MSAPQRRKSDEEPVFELELFASPTEMSSSTNCWIGFRVAMDEEMAPWMMMLQGGGEEVATLGDRSTLALGPEAA